MLKSNKIPSKREREREREGVESRNVQEQWTLWTIYLLFLSDYNPFPRNLDLIDLKLSLVNNFYLFLPCYYHMLPETKYVQKY